MYRLSIFLLASCLMFSLAKGDEGITAAGEKRVVCYYSGMLSQFGPVPDPDEVDPTLCTHIVLCRIFVNLTLYEKGGFEGYLNRTAKFKELNPKLKILMHVLGSTTKSEMPTSSAEISHVIKGAIHLLTTYGFDGLHFDWNKPKEDEEWLLSQFLTELRKEFDKRGFLIIIYFPQYESRVYKDQDLDVMKSTSDFIILGTIEYIDDHPNVTFISSPLQSVNATVEMYIAKQIPADKMVICIAATALSYKLRNINETGVGAKIDFIKLDSKTRQLIHYPQIMKNVRDGNWTAFRDEETNAPYVTTNDGQWISYEDPTSVRMKAAYVVEKNLGGAAIYFLDFDDYSGSAGEGRYPLTRALHDVIVRGHENEN